MTITANRLMNSVLRRKMTEAGIDLTAEQWGVLVQLWNEGCMAQDELAHVACVDKSSMSRLLSLMEDKGLVSRQVDPCNARRKIIRATAKAQQLREQSLAVSINVLELALCDVSARDAEICFHVLASVKRNLRKGESG